MKECEEAAAIFYDSYFLGVEGDVQFYVDEARRVGSAVLELGCGTGRVLLPLAEAGVHIVGLETPLPCWQSYGKSSHVTAVTPSDASSW